MASSSLSGKVSQITHRGADLPLFSEKDARTLAILMVTFSTVSIIAGSLSLYWFVRMRRAFRHHLIILLILSNLWRALWYFLFPIIDFSSGTIQTKSTYCQVSGFMLAFGIQGADFAVLAMAVHAALCIFKSSTEFREAGLYSYRKIVYALWVIFPALCSSLAFVNKDSAYVTTGGYCYLPVFPIWYRLALSWIPRYFILIAIAVIYLCIFLYVKRKFSRYQVSRDSCSSNGLEPRTSCTEETDGSQQTSPVRSDPNAIESAAPTLLGSVTPHLSERSRNEKSSADLGKSPGTPLWENYTFGASAPIAKLPDSATMKPDRSNLKLGSHRTDSRRDSNASRESITNIIRALEENQPTLDSRGYAQLTLTDSKDRPVKHASMRARHRVINRQMRMVFVYPLVYWFSWIVPFVSHCLSYNASYAQHPKLGLLATVNVILALQCAIDTLLFSLREKPWRARDTDNEYEKTFWGSLMPWRGREKRTRATSTVDTRAFPRTSSGTRRSIAAAAVQKATQFLSGGSSGKRSGRSKGANAAEAMAAKQRKNAENIEARQGAEDKRRKRQFSLNRRDGADRSWWEVEGRRRNDSVLLGSESTDPEKNVGMTASRTRGRPSVNPIDEGPEVENLGRHQGYVAAIVEESEGDSPVETAVGPSARPDALRLDTNLGHASMTSEISPKQRTPMEQSDAVEPNAS